MLQRRYLGLSDFLTLSRKDIIAKWQYTGEFHIGNLLLLSYLLPLEMCMHKDSREPSMENLLDDEGTELEFELHRKRDADDTCSFESYQLEGLVNTSDFPLKPWRGYPLGEKDCFWNQQYGMFDLLRTKPNRHILI